MQSPVMPPVSQTSVVKKKYKFRDNATGKEYTIDWEGEQPPTPFDLQQVFDKQSAPKPPELVDPDTVVNSPSGIQKAHEWALKPLQGYGQRAGKFVSDLIQDTPVLRKVAAINDAVVQVTQPMSKLPPGATMNLPEAIGYGVDQMTSPYNLGSMGMFGAAKALVPIAKAFNAGANTPQLVNRARIANKVAQGVNIANVGANAGFTVAGANTVDQGISAGDPGQIASGALQTALGMMGVKGSVNIARQLPLSRNLPKFGSAPNASAPTPVNAIGGSGPTPAAGSAVPNAPKGPTGGAPTIPANVIQNAYKHKGVTVVFESDIDRAAHYIAKGTDVKLKTDYFNFLKDNVHLTPVQIRQLGSDIHKHVGEVYDNSEDEMIVIPTLFKPTATPKSNAPVANNTPVVPAPINPPVSNVPVVATNAQAPLQPVAEVNKPQPVQGVTNPDQVKQALTNMFGPKPTAVQDVPIVNQPAPISESVTINAPAQIAPEPVVSITKKPLTVDNSHLSTDKIFTKKNLSSPRKGYTVIQNRKVIGEVYPVKGGWTFNDGPTFKNRELAASALTKVAHPDAPEDIQFARSDGGGIKIGADINSLGRVLGSSLYQGEITKIATKELLQNSLDAIRSLGSGGNVDVILDAKNNFVEIKDNGNGLTKKELETVFTDLGSSGKRNDTSAIGGFGLAKAAPLLGGESVNVTTVVREGGILFEHSFSGTPTELLDGVNVRTRRVPEGTTTGTTVRTYVPTGSEFYGAKQFVKRMAKHSPAIRGKIKVTEHGKWSMPQGDIENYGEIDLKDADVTSLSGQHVDVDLIIPKGTKYGPSAGVPLQLLNNGMWQASGQTGGYSQIPGVPETLLVNIKSKVPEGHPNYPFTANRENLRGEAKDLVDDYVTKNIINPAVGKRAQQLRDIYHNMPEMDINVTGRPFHIFDPAGRLTIAEFDAITSNKEMIAIADEIAATIRDVMRTASQADQGKLQKIGFIFESGLKGIHIPSPGENASVILINPFGIMSSNSPEQASAGLLHVILHEIAHVPGGGHDEDFAIRLSQVYERYGARAAVMAQDGYINVFTGGQGSDYTREIQEILHQYRDIIGRTGTKEDILSGTGITSRHAPEGPKRNGTDSGPARKGIVRRILDSDDEGSIRNPFKKEPKASTKRKPKPGTTEDIADGLGVKAKTVREKSIIKKKGKSASNKVLAALQDAIGIRAAQDYSDSVERAKRFQKGNEAFDKVGGGEKGYYARLRALKGELPIHEVEEHLQLNQADVDDLMNAIRNSDLLDGQQINAAGGLMTLIGRGTERVIQPRQIELLGHVFGNDFLTKVRSFQDEGYIINPLSGGWKLTSEIVNFPKGLMSVMDVSAPFRQGLGLVHRKEFREAFGPMFKALAKEENAKAVRDAIMNHPKYLQADEAGLALTDINTGREERMMSSLPEKIPWWGPHVVRPSNRAYETFLNKVRMDTFAAMDDEWVAWMNVNNDPISSTGRAQFQKELARYLNIVSGRGPLGSQEKNREELNMAFFSVGLLSSRGSMLFNWKNYFGGNKFVRKQFQKSMAAALTFASLGVGVGLLLGGDTDWDTRSPDFLKLKIGNVRLDFLGGLQQYIVEVSQLGHWTKVSSASGRETVFGEKYGSDDAMDDVYKFFESKESPSLSAFTQFMRQKKANGEKFTFANAALERISPIILQDFIDLYRENPVYALLIIPAAFGIGVQVQKPLNKGPLTPVREIKRPSNR